MHVSTFPHIHPYCKLWLRTYNIQPNIIWQSVLRVSHNSDHINQVSVTRKSILGGMLGFVMLYPLRGHVFEISMAAASTPISQYFTYGIFKSYISYIMKSFILFTSLIALAAATPFHPKQSRSSTPHSPPPTASATPVSKICSKICANALLECDEGWVSTQSGVSHCEQGERA